MSIILKPCPFCGSTEQHGIEFCICGSETALQMSRGAWNTRPIEDALQDRISKLQGELGQSIYTNSVMRDQMRRMEEELQSYAESLAAVKEANRWIPVEERSPEEIGRYEFLMIPTMAGEQHATIEAYDPAWGAISPLFTHWRPIEPPKEEE